MPIWTQENSGDQRCLLFLECATIKGIEMRNVGLKGLGVGWVVPCRWMH